MRIPILSQRSIARGAVSTECSANSFGFARERITALFSSAEVSTLVAELAHGDWGQLRGCVVLGFVLVHFVDGNCGVYD